MEYRVLGSTGLKVFPVGLGGIPIQRITEEEAKSVVKLCYELGMNFIDTAKGYTVSEGYVGKALKSFENDFIIATKSMGRTYEDMKREIDEALVVMDLQSIDLYQMHNVGRGEYEIVMGDNGAYKAMLEAKESGKIKHIGFTTHLVSELEKAIDSGMFETVQFPFNIVESQGEELLKKAKAKNIGTIGMKPLAGGAIDNAELAVRYVLNSGLIDVVIPGMASEDEIRENMASANKGMGFSLEEQKQVDEIKEQLNGNFCRRCGYCMPCPQGINIPMSFVSHKYISKYGLQEWGAKRYIAVNEKAKDCIKCMVCVKKCPYSLPIPEMLEKVKVDMNICIEELGLR